MIKFEIDEKVARITLNRPEKRNAMNRQMLEQLNDTFTAIDNTKGVNAIVIKATDPSFCAGSDLKQLGGMTLEEMCILEAEKAAFLRRISLTVKPVIASVQGYAIGGGAFLAAVCDVVVATQSSHFQCVEVPNGWISPWGFHALSARLSPRATQRLAWGYEPIRGEEAYHLGLADYVVAESELSSKTEEVAEQLANLPSISVSATKRFCMEDTLSTAEAQDAKLNALFYDHCQQEAAKKTLNKFFSK